MKKENLISLVGNCLFGIAILVCTLVFLLTNTPAYIIKTLDSALFLTCGAFNLALVYLFQKDKSNWKTVLMLCGLALAFVGDVLLIDFFIYGAIFFALGHVLFLVYFCLIQKVKWYDFVIGAGIFALALLLILLYPNFDFNGMQLLAIVYALVISLMLGKAIGNVMQTPSTRNILILVGAFLFFFSDLMLLFNVFGNFSTSIFDDLCLITYYPGEFLLSLSIFFYHKNQSLKKTNAKE